MTLSKTTQVIIYISLCLILCSIQNSKVFAETTNEEPSSYNIYATLNNQQKHNPKLKLELKNSSSDALEFYNSVLARNRISLVIIRDRGYGDILEEFLLFEGPDLGSFKIKPGQSYFKEIDLVTYFPKLIKELSKNNFVLFWHAKAKPLSEEHTPQRFGGYLLLEKEE